MFHVDKVLRETAGIYHIYAVKAGPLIKIGISNNLLQRFSNIYNEYICRTWSKKLYDPNAYDYPLQLMAYAQGNGATETLIHSLISEKKVHEDNGWGREWFYVDSELLEYIDLINECRIKGVVGIDVYDKLRNLRAYKIGEYNI